MSSSTFFSPVLLFLLSAFFISPCYADQVDLRNLNRCGPFVCPGGGSEENSISRVDQTMFLGGIERSQETISGANYIISESARIGEERSQGSRELRELPEDVPVPQSRPNNLEQYSGQQPRSNPTIPQNQQVTTSNNNDPSSQQTDTGFQGTNETNDNGSGTGNNMAGLGNMGSNQGSLSNNNSSTTGSKISVGNTSQQVGSFIYQDEEVKPEKIKAPQSAPNNNLARLTPPPSNTKTTDSNNNSTNNNKPNNQAFNAPGGAAPSNSLAATSTNNPTSSGNSAPIQSGGLFSKIASALGKNSFWASGGGSSSSRGAKQRAQQKQLASARRQLQNQLNRGNRIKGVPSNLLNASYRGLASDGGEYWGQQDSLYSGLCGIYAQYAQIHGIRDDFGKCP